MKESSIIEKRQLLRNNEYYTMQNTFDNLYEQSSKDKKFKDLMKCITSKENILLAYRKIKVLQLVEQIS